MATVSREVETKFSVHGLFALPDLQDDEHGIAAVRTEPALTLRATYVDTPSLRLARDGVTLRHRTGEGVPQWTLKLPAGGKRSGGLRRDELSVPGPATQLPDELHELLTPFLRGEEVAPVAVLQTSRRTHTLLAEDETPLAEVVDDTVSLLEGRRVVSRFREIEVEQAADDDRAVQACAAAGERLLAAGAVAGAQLPKVARALGPQAQQPSDLPAPPSVDRDGPASALVLWSLRTGLARLVASDVGVRRSEPDAVHQMRVACRRLRSDLRTLAPLLDDPRTQPLRVELAWLADALGEARDLEVLLERVAKTARQDPLAPLDVAGVATVRRLLREQEEAAVEAARQALRTDRYVALLRLLTETAQDPGLTDLGRSPCRTALPPLVGKAWSHLAKRASRLRQDDPDEAWHRARILAKRARYAAEVAAQALGKSARSTAAAATAVQEVLGEHQDAAVAADRVLALAASTPADLALAVTCGRLAERERAHVRDSRAAFPATWAHVRKGKATAWLP